LFKQNKEKINIRHCTDFFTNKLYETDANDIIS